MKAELCVDARRRWKTKKKWKWVQHRINRHFCHPNYDCNRWLSEHFVLAWISALWDILCVRANVQEVNIGWGVIDIPPKSAFFYIIFILWQLTRHKHTAISRLILLDIINALSMLYCFWLCLHAVAHGSRHKKLWLWRIMIYLIYD